MDNVLPLIFMNNIVPLLEVFGTMVKLELYHLIRLRPASLLPWNMINRIVLAAAKRPASGESHLLSRLVKFDLYQPSGDGERGGKVGPLPLWAAGRLKRGAEEAPPQVKRRMRRGIACLRVQGAPRRCLGAIPLAGTARR